MNFYVIRESEYESRQTLRLSVARPPDWSMSRILRGEVPPGPLLAKVHMGTEPVDYTDAAALHVVSERFRRVVQAANLSGAVFHSLVVPDSSDKWYLLGVTGRCGPFDYSASVRLERHFPGGDATYLRGFVLPLDTWSRDDFCVPPVANLVIVTEAAVEALQAANLQHVAFTPIEKHEIAERLVRGTTI
ncbi:MAG TPA: hypothetical protein VIN65_08355 [Candidatus Dormibacteraeota bacterium]